MGSLIDLMYTMSVTVTTDSTELMKTIDTAGTVITVILGIVFGLLLAAGIIYNSIVNSNTMGDEPGSRDQFKKPDSEHYFAKEKEFREFDLGEFRGH